MVDGFAKTPRYVLKEGPLPTCPAVSQASSGVKATVIFGFSDKPEYDIFLSASSLALTPYPLVDGYLKNHIERESVGLKLVVLDAASPDQANLYTATFQSVLQSRQDNAESVEISHQLVLNESSQEYRIEESSRSAPAKSAP